MSSLLDEAGNVPSGQATLPVNQRHRLVDGLRGLALLGIVIVNVEFILQHSSLGWRGDTSTLDLVTRWLVTVFGALKIYPLFALLFGYGLSVQLARAAQRGTGIGPRYARRMLGLVILGVLHAVLFFPGDILVVYAVVGALAFLIRCRSSASLVRTAIAVYATAAVVWLLVGFAFLVTATPFYEQVTAESVQILSSGGFAQVIGLHVADWLDTVVVLALVQGPAAFAFILVGIVLGRTDVLTNPAAHRRKARRVLIVAGSTGLLGGAVGATLALQSEATAALGLLVGFAAAPGLSAAYLAATLLVWDALPRFISRILQASGRMFLSVYLLQSALLSTLAYGYGVGLFGTLSPLEAILVAVGVWTALSLFSVLWLKIARFGPVEWLLRSFSYWRIQPLAYRNVA